MPPDSFKSRYFISLFGGIWVWFNVTQANCCLFTSAQWLPEMHLISVLVTGRNDGEIKYRCIGLMLLLENSGTWNLLTSDVEASILLKYMTLGIWRYSQSVWMLPWFWACYGICLYFLHASLLLSVCETELQNVELYHRTLWYRMFCHLERNILKF